MTDIFTSYRIKRGFAQSLRLWLSSIGCRTPTANPDSLSDHILRDIGAERDPLRPTSIRSRRGAMPFSG